MQKTTRGKFQNSLDKELQSLQQYRIYRISSQKLDRIALYAAPNRTDTSFDTPGSCMVTP
jgi:hypothetical protein